MSWVPGSNKMDKSMADVVFWLWQLESRAYWRLEEVDGLGDWDFR